MSAWLNVPVEIIEDYRVVRERQDYLQEGSDVYRTRIVTTYVYLYVGCDYAGAKVKADALVLNPAYSDLQVIPAGGGQYHCRANYKSEGAWGAWENS